MGASGFGVSAGFGCAGAAEGVVGWSESAGLLDGRIDELGDGPLGAGVTLIAGRTEGASVDGRAGLVVDPGAGAGPGPGPGPGPGAGAGPGAGPGVGLRTGEPVVTGNKQQVQ